MQFICFVAHVFVAINPFLDAFYLFHLFLGTLRVVPKIRGLGAQVLLFEFYFLLVDIEISVQCVDTREHILQLVASNHTSSLYISSISAA